MMKKLIKTVKKNLKSSDHGKRSSNISTTTQKLKEAEIKINSLKMPLRGRGAFMEIQTLL